MAQRLLILSCAQRKNLQPDPLPAVLRYDGPAFRVLRRYLGTEPAPDDIPDIFVVSAFFGLIPGNQLIPDYDSRMTRQRADELRPAIIETLGAMLSRECYTEMFLSLGAQYGVALDGYESLLSPTMQLHVATGSPGRKLGALYDWLHGSPASNTVSPGVAISKPARLRGIEVNLTAEQVLAAGRDALARSPAQSATYQTWYVEVDNNPVSPKWLISHLTGLPVSSFNTSDARRVLAQLGVPVERVNTLDEPK
jgi:hypothetical protein